MTAIEKQTKDVLDRVKAKFKDLSKAQIVNLLNKYKELQPKAEKYVDEVGEYRDLCSISGTIPVEYRGKHYNIPVEMYLPEDFPYRAPICYVRPTPLMSINVNETVDASGKINHQYLASWSKTSELKNLVSAIAVKFGEKTPLYNKNTGNVRPPSGGQMNSTPGYPTNGAPVASAQPLSNVQYPSYSQSNPSLPYPTQNTYPNAVPSGAHMPTPYPPVISNASNQPYGSYNPYTPAGYSNMPTPSLYNNQQRPPIPPPPSIHAANYNQARPVSSQVAQQIPNSNYSDETLKPEYVKMSLISAVSDKARKRYAEHKDTIDAEIDSLRRTLNDLERGKSQINEIIVDAEIEIENIKRYTSEIKQKTGLVNENLNKMKHREKADAQDAVIPLAPLYRQIMQLFAEELAIQDLIYYLNDGLRHKTVNLESYLKQTRALSRKLFMVRALILKCRETANLRT